MGSFNACSFVEGRAPTFPTWNKKTILTIRDLPTNTPTILDVGMDVQRLALVVRVSGTQLTALYDQVLESGSLVMAWETHNAFLESISDVAEQGAGHDVYFATLNLIRL